MTTGKFQVADVVVCRVFVYETDKYVFLYRRGLGRIASVMSMGTKNSISRSYRVNPVLWPASGQNNIECVDLPGVVIGTYAAKEMEENDMQPAIVSEKHMRLFGPKVNLRDLPAWCGHERDCDEFTFEDNK